MENKFLKPKRASEILDLTFTLTKNHFKNFFLIMLIFMGPVYLLQAIVELASGTSFFREISASGGPWYEQFLSNFEQNQAVDPVAELTSGITLIIIGLILALTAPIAEAAILFAINHIRKDEEYTIGAVIKQSFSRFWPMLGSNILFGVITFGLFIAPTLLITFFIIFMKDINVIATVLIAIFLILGSFLGIGLLLTRWSFYFGSVVLDKDAPGLARSWRLTKGRTWVTIGLYIVFYLIISMVSSTIQFSLMMALGNSVLLQIIINLVTIITTMIFLVGYAVMYFDLKTRHDADDLKEMLDEYDNFNNQLN